jgi:hypothetical protein
VNTLLHRALLSLAALTAATAASAVTLPFEASYSGVANVVEVIDATVPVLRFATFATGSGTFDLGAYFSTDVIDMSAGTGAGVNVFTAGNGDELHGSFTVQVIPTAATNIVDLIGQATFIGGTGLFSGASGSASFSGTGVFTSATSALAGLAYNGSISLVPEPGSGLLLSLGVAALVLRRARRPPA